MGHAARLRGRLSGGRDLPSVATLDDALWRRVGEILVRRQRITREQLDVARGDARLTGKPLDEVLVSYGYATRQAVASTVLAVQLGFEGHGPPSGVSRLADSVSPPGRRFALWTFAVDLALLVLAVAGTVVGHRRSTVPLPSAGWVAGFLIMTLIVYWSWRVYARNVKLRPLADAVLVAGAASVAGMLVLTVRSLTGWAGLGDELLPLWAFAAVYGVAGRLAYYLVCGAVTGSWLDRTQEDAAISRLRPLADVVALQTPARPARLRQSAELHARTAVEGNRRPADSLYREASIA